MSVNFFAIVPPAEFRRACLNHGHLHEAIDGDWRLPHTRPTLASLHANPEAARLRRAKHFLVAHDSLEDHEHANEYRCFDAFTALCAAQRGSYFAHRAQLGVRS